MKALQSFRRLCGEVAAILALLLLPALSSALAHEDTQASAAVASADSLPTDEVAAGMDLGECAPSAQGQRLYCDHACCNVQASGPVSSLDDDQPAVIAQPGAPVPRRIEIRLIASATLVPISPSPRFLLFRNFRE